MRLHSRKQGVGWGRDTRPRRRPVRAVIVDAEPVGAGTRYVFVTNTRRRSTARTLPRTASEPERRGARRPKGLPTRTVAIGLLGAALCLGLGLAIPTAPLGPDSEQVAQSVWSDPRPSFLASAVGGNVAPSSQRGLVPVKAPEVLSVPVAASHDPSAAAGPGGIRVKVFFSRHPESESAFSAVFPVTRVAPDRAVATAALTSLLQGPSDSERASGYFSELGAAVTGASSCGGRGFRIAIVDGTATVQFCRALTSAGAGQDARIRSQIEATLRQFSTVRSVRLLDSAGHCLFDASGEDRCMPPAPGSARKPGA
jgi:hypothetical protein